MEQSARDVVTTWLNAVVSGDADTAIALSSSSFVFTTGNTRTYRGPEGIRDIVEDFARLPGFLEVSVDGEILESDGVVALRRTERYLLPAGGVEVRGCSFVEVSDGLVTTWADYRHMETIEAVAG